MCFADHSVCWIRAKREQSWKGKMWDQSAHSLLFPHSGELIYLIAASDTQYLSGAWNLTKISPTYVAEWQYYFSCSANRSPHEAKRECVGEREDKASIAPTHTQLSLSAQQPERTPLLPYLKRCQSLVPCQKQAHFHRQSQEAFWQGGATLLFLDTAFSAQPFGVQSWETWQWDNGRLRGSWRLFWSAYGASTAEQKGSPS